MNLRYALKNKEFAKLTWVKEDENGIPKFGVCCVYLFVSGGKIVYIGSTKCLKKRVANHFLYNKNYSLYFSVTENIRCTERILLNIARPMFNVNVGFNKNKYQDKLSKSVTLRVKIIGKNIKKVKKEIKILHGMEA